ncbi:MAG: Hsp20/alpha crystallin family protein [Acidimicrobiia bacterium]|nr:Hsp20/alpha crystallin family protein [Acidimicrobiia bacterium]
MFIDPLAEFDRLAREMNNRQSFMPVDVYRWDDKFYLHFDLPGIDPESIDITVERGTLTVTAERNWSPSDEAQVLVRERRMGTITRRFRLGDGLDPDKIEAGYDHGVLTLTIPVSEEEKPRKITVGASDHALTG